MQFHDKPATRVMQVAAAKSTFCVPTTQMTTVSASTTPALCPPSQMAYVFVHQHCRDQALPAPKHMTRAVSSQQQLVLCHSFATPPDVTKAVPPP